MKDGNENANTTSTYDRIAQRAYDLWEKTGRQQGRETEHWLQAEAEVSLEDGQRGARAGSSQNKSGSRRVFTA